MNSAIDIASDTLLGRAGIEAGQLEATLGQGGPKRLGRETQGIINSVA